MENLHAASHFTQHKTFSALNYAQDFGNRVKESLKRTSNLKWATLTNCPMSNTFMPLIALSTMSLPLVHDKRRWSWDGGGLDRELSTSLTTNYKKRINSRWRGIFSTSVMGLSHGICYLFKKLKRFFLRLLNSKNTKNNGPVWLFKTLFWHWYCFPSSVAMDCKDWKWIETWATNKIQDTHTVIQSTR